MSNKDSLMTTKVFKNTESLSSFIKAYQIPQMNIVRQETGSWEVSFPKAVSPLKEDQPEDQDPETGA